MSNAPTQNGLRFLEDKWNEAEASKLDGPELLRYRSNLLGSDLRITNFGGGNTSSKLESVDPVDGTIKSVLWVKGSGGDLGSIKRAGFATLYLDKLLELEKQYEGVAREDAMVALYPLVTFGNNPTAASIDTSLHGFLPFPHVDHLHPDWGIALAASANGKQKMEDFNAEFGHKLAWLPWQRPGFELGMMLRSIVQQTPGCDGVVLGGHGLFKLFRGGFPLATSHLGLEIGLVSQASDRADQADGQPGSGASRSTLGCGLAARRLPGRRPTRRRLLRGPARATGAGAAGAGAAGAGAAGARGGGPGPGGGRTCG